MNEFFQATVILGLLTAGVRLATPFLFAGLGEMLSQRSGVLNLGVEGIMLIGAFVSFFVAFETGNLYLGLLAAALAGAFMGLLTAFVSVTMKAVQGISGIGIHILGLGLSGLFFRLTMGSISTMRGFPRLSIPVLKDIPVLGQVLFNQNWMVYAALLLVPVSWAVIYKTTFGLKVRSVGENPHAADSLGISVTRVRYICVVIGSVMASIAGAFLTIGQHEAAFVNNIAAGRGFIAVALVYFAKWNPLGVLAGAFLFSMIDAFQLRIQIIDIGIPYEIPVMLPYILTIVVLALSTRGRVLGPTALTKPFVRGVHT